MNSLNVLKTAEWVWKMEHKKTLFDVLFHFESPMKQSDYQKKKKKLVKCKKKRNKKDKLP